MENLNKLREAVIGLSALPDNKDAAALIIAKEGDDCMTSFTGEPIILITLLLGAFMTNKEFIEILRFSLQLYDEKLTDKED